MGTVIEELDTAQAVVREVEGAVEAANEKVAALEAERRSVAEAGGDTAGLRTAIAEARGDVEDLDARLAKANAELKSASAANARRKLKGEIAEIYRRDIEILEARLGVLELQAQLEEAQAAYVATDPDENRRRRQALTLKHIEDHPNGDLIEPKQAVRYMDDKRPLDTDTIGGIQEDLPRLAKLAEQAEAEAAR